MGENKSDEKSNIKAIILAGLVSLIVGVGSGWIINVVTEKQAKLTYDITTQEVFSGSSNNIGIFGIRISNTGKKEIEEVLSQLVFSEADISEYKISGIPDASRKVKSSGSSFEINVPYLNPEEQVSIQILLKPTTKSLAPPLIDIRGKGVVGVKEEKEDQSKSKVYRLLSVAMAALATLITAITLSRRSIRSLMELSFEKRLQKETDASEYHHADQRDTVAFVLEAKGLYEEAKSVRTIPRDISYWSIVDSLVSEWLKKNDKTEIKKSIDALDYLMEYASVADSSKQIIHLNISRLAMAISEKTIASTHLTKAIEKDSIIMQKRISQYPELNSIIGEIQPNKANTADTRTSRG